jgi:hypothetical protein
VPGDKPRSGDKPAQEHERGGTEKKATWSPQKVSPQGGGTGNYQGGAASAPHERGYATDRAPEGGADDQHQPSTHQEGRPSLPSKATSGGADQIERGTSLADKSKT